jgi:hypothetical protein
MKNEQNNEGLGKIYFNKSQKSQTLPAFTVEYMIKQLSKVNLNFSINHVFEL